MNKYLFISNSGKPTKEQRMSRDSIKMGNVRKPCLDAAHHMGYEVWAGVNRDRPEELTMEADYPVHLYDSHTYRSLFALRDNWTAFRNTMKVLKQGGFEVVHCNTPIGGVIGRLCGKLAGVKTVIYTAHGFHFYKGAPLLNRTILKWAEQLMARWTDVMITMNQEDYEAAQKFKLRKGGKVYMVPGVGIDTEMYKNIRQLDATALRRSLGLKDEDIVCISMGDLVARKNYSVAIESVAKCQNTNIHYLICGKGPELESLQDQAKHFGIETQVHFLGFRSDIKELLKVSDIFLFTTLQEGLPRSMMEAMASGLPCVVSDIRGNRDLISDGNGGYLVAPDDVDGFARRIQMLAENAQLREQMCEHNLKRIQEFDISIVEDRIMSIYESTMGNER